MTLKVISSDWPTNNFKVFLENILYYSNNYDFVPFALPSRYSYNVTVIDRRPPLHTVTDRYGPFPIVTERYMRYRTLQALHALQALQSITERFKRYIFYLTKNFKWTVLKLIYCLSIKLLFAKMFISFFI